jgi:D-alanyl-D-alanine carboxypeptidase
VPSQAPESLTAKLQSIVTTWHATSGAPGVGVGIVLKDGSMIGLAAGVSDKATQRPMRSDDVFLAGSTGKTFFAALAVQLIDEGKLDLDAPVSKYLGARPWYSKLPNAEAITVRHLMTHTSGLVRYEFNPKFLADLKASPQRVWAPEEQLAYLFDAAPPFAPGKGWEYSDTNYIVLAMVLESVTGTTAYDEIARRFLVPLSLRRVIPQTGPILPGLITGYAGPGDPLGMPDVMLVDGQLAVNPRFEWGGGGFATSPMDLARWGYELYAGKALSTAARARMLDAAVPAALGQGTLYGLGVIVRPTTPAGPTVGHSGFFPGYLTELVHLRERGITIAVQANTSAGVRRMLRLVYDLATGLHGTDEREDRADCPSADRPLQLCR